MHTLMLMRSDFLAHNGAHLDAAEELLLRAERRILPHEAPTKFRQIAERYLQLYRTRLSAAQDASDRERVEFSHARTAAYFRHMLKDLDAIAIGK